MKKLFLFNYIFICSVCNAQNFNKVYSMKVFYYENEAWTTKPIQYPETMFIITEDYTIRITNKNNTTFITYGNPYSTKTKEYDTYTWPGCDKNDNECLFSIIKAKGCRRMLYIIFLENEITEYIVDP